MRARWCPRSSSHAAERFEDLQGRLDASEEQGALEDTRAAAKAELEDASTATNIRAALTSELEHKRPALEEECKGTM